MESKVNYGSLDMFRALDARGQRQQTDHPGNTGGVRRKGYVDALVAKIDEYDPEGKKAYALGVKYHNKQRNE